VGRPASARHYAAPVSRIVTRAHAWDLLRRAQGVAKLELRIAELERRLSASLTRVDLDAALARIGDQLDAVAAQVGPVDAQLGPVAGQLSGIGGQLGALDGRLAALDGRLAASEGVTAGLDAYVRGEVRALLGAIASEDAENRRRLWSAREDPAYERPFTEPDPLVSIVMPTAGRPESLRDLALPSVLGQSYERLEVIVVGNHVSPLTERAIAALGDPRVRFHNLTQQLVPRPEPAKQWAIADVLPRSEGFRLARGMWIGTFDDDDEMRPGSIQRLLDTARERRAEIAYGRFNLISADGQEVVGDFPPRPGRFSMTAALRHRSLGFFERQLFAADLGLPSDILESEAMLRAGVRFAMIPDVILDYHPSRLGQA
jgi:hypothetical protein